MCCADENNSICRKSLLRHGNAREEHCTRCHEGDDGDRDDPRRGKSNFILSKIYVYWYHTFHMRTMLACVVCQRYDEMRWCGNDVCLGSPISNAEMLRIPIKIALLNIVCVAWADILWRLTASRTSRAVWRHSGLLLSSYLSAHSAWLYILWYELKVYSCNQQTVLKDMLFLINVSSAVIPQQFALRSCYEPAVLSQSSTQNRRIIRCMFVL